MLSPDFLFPPANPSNFLDNYTCTCKESESTNVHVFLSTVAVFSASLFFVPPQGPIPLSL